MDRKSKRTNNTNYQDVFDSIGTTNHDKWKKRNKFRKRIIAFLVVVLFFVGLWFNAFFIEPNLLRVRYEVIASEKIPDDLNNFTILFFSDLHYGKFVGNNRVKKVVNEINDIGANAVIFLGDLYDESSFENMSIDAPNELLNILKEIKASYGKFAVLGEHDYQSIDNQKIIDDTLYNSGFEVLDNKNITLHFGTNQSINLIALANQINGKPNIKKAFASIDKDAFNIVISHTPDIALELNQELVDFFIAGHTHGGEISFPFFGGYYQPEASKVKRNLNKDREFNFVLDITNGVGTTKVNARFNSPAELVVYRFVKK